MFAHHRTAENPDCIVIFFDNTRCDPIQFQLHQTWIPIQVDDLESNENKINLSQENLNLIVERAQGDRINLKNELQKVINLSQNNKKFKKKIIADNKFY